MRGLFVTFEGVDGCGKSTQVARLAQSLEAQGYPVLCLREPGGTPLSEKIRSLLLDPANGDMVPEAELLLYEASRAQLVRQVIRPALAAGQVVLCDRFYDSTTAYQQAGRGLDARMVSEANRLGSCGLAPDVTLWLKLDPAQGLARATGAHSPDRLEQEGVAFQEAVATGFEALAAKEPQRVVAIDASGTPEQVETAIYQVVSQALEVCGLRAAVAADSAHSSGAAGD